MAVGVGIFVDVIDTRVGVEVGSILVAAGVESGSLSTPQPVISTSSTEDKKSNPANFRFMQVTP